MATQIKTLPKPKPFDLERAEVFAEEIVRELSPACDRILVVGSIRRQVPQVHDIDIVLAPVVEFKYTGQLSLFDAAPVPTAYPRLLFSILAMYNWGAYSFGEYPRIIRFVYQKIPIELWVAEPDGCNFGALLQMRTGSERFNIGLGQRAHRLGLRYQAGHGVYDGQQRIDDDTEAGIFQALQMDWIEPDKRL